MLLLLLLLSVILLSVILLSMHCQEPNRCINFIKFYTSKGRSMGFGNSASTAPLVTAKPPMQGGFLAFLKGWEDVVSVKNSTAGTEAQVCFLGGPGFV